MLCFTRKKIVKFSVILVGGQKLTDTTISWRILAVWKVNLWQLGLYSSYFSSDPVFHFRFFTPGGTSLWNKIIKFEKKNNVSSKLSAKCILSALWHCKQISNYGQGQNYAHLMKTARDWPVIYPENGRM